MYHYRPFRQYDVLLNFERACSVLLMLRKGVLQILNSVIPLCIIMQSTNKGDCDKCLLDLYLVDIALNFNARKCYMLH